jgi:hypothetical protein
VHLRLKSKHCGGSITLRSAQRDGRCWIIGWRRASVRYGLTVGPMIHVATSLTVGKERALVHHYGSTLTTTLLTNRMYLGRRTLGCYPGTSQRQRQALQEILSESDILGLALLQLLVLCSQHGPYCITNICGGKRNPCAPLGNYNLDTIFKDSVSSGARKRLGNGGRPLSFCHGDLTFFT